MVEASSPKPNDPQWTHRWISKKTLPERFGKLCKVVRGPYRPTPMGDLSARTAEGAGMRQAQYATRGISFRVQFEDGFSTPAMRFQVRRRGAATPGRAPHPGSR